MKQRARRGATTAVLVAGLGLIVPVIGARTSPASPGAGTISTDTAPVTDAVVQAAVAPAITTPFPSTGRFHPVTPVRVLDSRDGTGGVLGAVGPSGTITLRMAGTPTVPVGASAVVVNLTATGTSEAGFLTAYPAGGTAPNASSVNFARGATSANLALVKLGSDGGMSIFNSAGTTHVVVDVMGWYDSWFDPAVVGGGSLIGLEPSRVLDTRNGNGGTDVRARGAGEITTVAIRGRGGLPNDPAVTSVVMNVTAVAPTDDGFLTVFPSDAAVPGTSNVNFVRGQTIPNLVMVKLGADGAVKVFNYAGSTHVLFDVVGYTTSAATNGAGQMFPVTPTRIFDTRNGTGSTSGPARIGPGVTKQFDATGTAGVPNTGVSAVALNVTVVKPTASGYITLYPDGGQLTGDASNLNFVPDDVIPNLVVTKVGPGGGVNIWNPYGSVDVVVDVVGWYTADTAFDLRTFTAPQMARADGGSDDGNAGDGMLSQPAQTSAALAGAFTEASLRNASDVGLRARVGSSSALSASQELLADDAPGAVQAAAGGFQPDYLTWDAGFAALNQLPSRTSTSPGAIGRLYIALDNVGGTGTCSGTVIDLDLVMTAAHCVYEAQGPSPHFYRAWGFVPGQYGPVTLSLPTDVNPGFWVTSNVYLRAEYGNVVDPWFNSPGLSSVDYAVVRFAPKTINGRLTHIGEVTGTIPLQVNAPLGPRLVVGYPSGFASPQFAAQCADPVADECYPYFCFSPISSYWLNVPQPGLTVNSFELGLGCHTSDKFPNGPAPGVSGGPWLANFDGQWRLVSVSSNGPVVQDQFGNVQFLRNVWGPYLDGLTTDLVAFAKAAP
ncbi:MAG: serine protease [Acidimicrobiia bacterium]